MIRFAIFFTGIFILILGIYVYLNPEETFVAKFKNIDGLPTGAPVTALGVKIGEVIKTKSVSDGVLVTVRIINKSISKPPKGSQLSITSFRPNQGRVLEIVPSGDVSSSEKALIIQEPITNETWLYSSIELLDGLKTFSEHVIKQVTPENFEKVRLALSIASESLNETANNLLEHESDLISVKQKLDKKAEGANALLVRLKKPIASLNKVLSDKNLSINFKNDLAKISDDLTRISEGISDPKTLTNLKNFKTDILNHLNDVNVSLNSTSDSVQNSTLSKNLMEFNSNLQDLNTLYEEVSKKDVAKMAKKTAKQAREVTTMLAEKTSNIVR